MKGPLSTRPDSSDQARRLRELVRRRSPRMKSLSILSGKGGVGKTSIAVNLSIMLASKGMRVVLIDADMGLANADLLMNLKPRYTLAHVLSGTRTLSEVCIKGPGGVFLIPGASGLSRLADITDSERQRLIVELRKLDASTDMTIVDCGAGISSNVLNFALATDRIMVVTTPEPTAITDAYATIKALQAAGCRKGLGLFVNRASGRSQAQATHQRLVGVAKRFLNFSVAEFGYMLQDSAVEQAVRAQYPFVLRSPGSNASACLAVTASGFARLSARSTTRVGWFSRVAGMFV